MHFLHPHFSYLADSIKNSKVVRFEYFSDGWPRILLEDKECVSGKEVTYIGDFRHVGDFFSQIAFIDGLSRYHIDSLNIIIPFFPAASMERDTPHGELSIANVFARTFGLIWERHPGRVHLHLYDIHDEREIFYFPPSLQIHHHSTTDILKEKINLHHQKPVILFPDVGAKKAFSRFFHGYEIVTCAKIRKSIMEIEMFFEWGVLENKDVLIVDDHIRSGGTLVEACRYAREKWATTVSAFAPHAVFADGVKPDFLEAFDRLYVTDTIPLNRERFCDNPKVEVIHFMR